ncbi:MAG: DUF3352 domain-containing protein [Candidatus Dormibacteria bacterium]
MSQGMQPPARPRRRRRVVVAALAVLVVAAGTTGAILGFRVLGGSADSLQSLVPSDSAIYVNVHLDPSAGQKLALNGLLDKFPALSGSSRDTTINGWLDSALRPTGLTHDDVRPWLGSDVSFVSSGAPDAAALISSTNDSAAQAAITKLQQKSDHPDQWTTSTYNGVTVTSNADAGVFAVTDHAMIIGSAAGVVHEIIDTALGKHAAIASSSSFTEAVGQVPSDRIALVYVEPSAIAQSLLKSAASALPQNALSSLQAYRGVALAVVAHSDGVSVSGVEDLDTSKMSAAQRAQLSEPPHDNGSLALMPASSYAAATVTGLKETLQGLVDEAGAASGFDLSSILQQLGLTGPNGIVGHLSGDAGIDLTPESGANVPGGALAIGTDSDSAAQQFMSNLVATVCNGFLCDASQLTHQQYDGADITSVAPSTVASGIDPSWAVFHGWIITGSTPDQVRAALDADRSGHNVTGNADYGAVMSQVGGSSNNGSFFVDVQPLLSAFHASMPSDLQAEYLKPLKAFGMAVHNASDHVSIDMFTLIQ